MKPGISAGTLMLLMGALFSSPAHAEDAIKVIIVAGQSNAVGYNNVREYRGGQQPFPAAFRIQPGIRFWPGKAAVTATDDLWTTLRVQGSGAFGPEIGLAHDLANALQGEDLAIVKYAEGGTGIARSKDYTDYIPQLSHFNDRGRNWYPSSDPQQAGILYNALNSHTWAFGDTAREGQAQVCRQDPHVTLVRTVDLSRQGSGGAAHFDAEGMLSLGTRCAAALVLLTTPQASTPAVTLSSLLEEMVDRKALARYPEPAYRSLQASSYNRLSVARDQPGWFADADGVGFIRTEKINDRTEWVIMEHDGPGCITKMWTPFFYYRFDNRTGPDIRIYLDGNPVPAIDENFIALTRGQGSFKPPFGAPTARAGNTYLPIPFATSCKVTLTGKAFYNIINYRVYPQGTEVVSFDRAQLTALTETLETTGRTLYDADPLPATTQMKKSLSLEPAGSKSLALPPGPAAVVALSIRVPADSLRSLVLAAEFDGEKAIWCPVGDLFCSADSLHPFHSWERTVEKDGTMTCRWVMPYRSTAALRLENHGQRPVTPEIDVATGPWTWDDASMHFHASWRPDQVLPGHRFVDWNFIDIRGRGVFVGDVWTVLNPTQGWWGEGDEKIYVDGAWEARFPSHFGTGTEDYYGWAGGTVPTRADEFDEPFLVNARIGGVDGNRTRGFNICSRTRVLDAIPFNQRLRFDMEASPGTGQRGPADFLGYAATTFWYARPGATHNRAPMPAAAAKPIMSLADLASKADGASRSNGIKGAIEFEALKPSAHSPGLSFHAQKIIPAFHPQQWSREQHLFIAAKKPGDFLEFTISEQFQPRALKLVVTTSYDFGVARIAVNGRTRVDRLDLYSERPSVRTIDLGTLEPVNNAFVIRYELVKPNPSARGARTYLGLDCLLP